MRIIVDTEKLAKFIYDNLSGDCCGSVLCAKYCEQYKTCVESIEMALINDFQEKESEVEE